MCGIAGVFGQNDIALVRSMLAQMVHRGPDDEHAVCGDDFAFGARRLSIVGVADGRQPLSNPGRTVWAAQNGELYNYPTVRELLESNGIKLRTGCDTEMLPYLYERHGADLVSHIDGMFAIAIWDVNGSTGIIARDRMGKKPLYYYQRGGALYFASEIKCLLRIPGFERKVNLEALHHYLSFKHVPCPLTIFEGIHMLPPAHRIIFKKGEDARIERYWDLDFSANPELERASEEELSDRLLELLRAGVKRRLMSDVPVGFFLSGGIDSSLSTVLAAEMSSTPIKTFTLGYASNSTTEGKEQDAYWAERIAKQYKTEHHQETIEFSRFPENLRRIIASFDEPFAGTVSTYFLAGRIAQHVKVAISGDGADELFGSYLSHRLAFPLSRYEEYKRTGQKDLIRPFEDQVPLLERLSNLEDWHWRYQLLVLSEQEKSSLYSADLAATMRQFSSQRRMQNDFSTLTAGDPLNRILEAEYRTLFPDQVLAFVDRLSMAHSLEVRSAYLDTEFVNFAARLPGRLKIKDGETKYLLKKAALKYFPPEMVFRKKEGFLLPITDWIGRDLEAYVRETLSPSRLRSHGIFDADGVAALVDKLYEEQCDYTQVNKVFALLVFQEWYDLYMSPANTTAAAAV